MVDEMFRRKKTSVHRKQLLHEKRMREKDEYYAKKALKFKDKDEKEKDENEL